MSKKFRKDFSFLKYNKKTIYLDSAASSLKLNESVKKQSEFLLHLGTNIDRSMYKEGIEATHLYEATRENVAKFLNAESNEIIFTSGTTEGLNIIANGIKHMLSKDSNIIISRFEHNSSLLPYIILQKQIGFKIKYLDIDNNIGINIDNLENLIDNNTKLVIVSMSSNVLGIHPNIKEICNVCHKQNILVISDAAQYVSHNKIDVKDLDIDFLCFSGHKMYSSNGIGVLYGKYKNLEKLTPYKYGGGMISYFENNYPVLKDIPHRFEAGTPNASNVISLNQSINYINKIGFETINKIENSLLKYTLSKLSDINDVIIINKQTSSPLISFIVDKIHPHDLLTYFANYNICLRGGFHCAEELLRYLNYTQGCLRVSFAFYNTKKEIDIFIDILKKAILFFKGK